MLDQTFEDAEAELFIWKLIPVLEVQHKNLRKLRDKKVAKHQSNVGKQQSNTNNLEGDSIF